MKDLAWDDLRYVCAVAESGSVRQGAARLGVSHQTVSRHVARIERALGVPLFIKSSAGYLLTPAAEELVRTAERVEEMIGDAARRLAARDVRPAGTVRLATIGWLMPSLCSDWALLRERFPEITLELSATTQIASFARREVDVAVRMAREPMGDLVGRRIATSRAAIFGSKGYLARRPKHEPLNAHDWIGLAGPWATLRPGQWLEEHVPTASVVARSSAPSAVLHLIRAGVGVGLLPCFVGDADPALERVRDDVVEALDVPVWLLTHPDIRRAARVRVVMEFLEERLTAKLDRFEGRLA